MVFPEGVGGSGKTIFKRYELQKFGTGFVRLALETRSPIVPTAVIVMSICATSKATRSTGSSRTLSSSDVCGRNRSAI